MNEKLHHGMRTMKKTFCKASLFSRSLAALLAAVLFCSCFTITAWADEEATELAAIYIESESGVDSTDEYSEMLVSVRDSGGNVLMDETLARWELHGRSTRQTNKKAYNIKFYTDTDMFGMGAAKKWVLLANAYDKTLIRNKLIYDLGADLGAAYPMESRFVELYINGRYRGNYLLSEAPQVNSERVDINMAKDEFLLEILPIYRSPEGEMVTTPVFNLRFTLNSLTYLPPDQRSYLEDFMQKAEDALMSCDKDRIAEYFDIDSFLNAYIIYELSKNADIAMGSTRFTLRDGKLYAGPLWDFDLSLGNSAYDPGPRQNFNGTVPCLTDGWYGCQLWWAQLVRCDWFLELFAQRYIEIQDLIVNLYEDNELGMNRIDALVSSMQKSIDKNYSIWPVDARLYANERISDPTYEQNVESLRTWIRERNAWILAQIQNGGTFITVDDESYYIVSHPLVNQ